MSFEEDSLLDNPSEHTICRIITDFNSDGIKDLAFSDSYLCGAHACSWEIYLGSKTGMFTYFQDFWFNDFAIRIDSISNGISRIFIYDKASGGVGDFIEYNLSIADGIKKLSKKSIHPDSEDNNEDRILYKKTFSHYQFEKSCINILDYLKTKIIVWE